jgi:hypothetical protein
MTVITRIKTILTTENKERGAKITIVLHNIVFSRRYTLVTNIRLLPEGKCRQESYTNSYWETESIIIRIMQQI